MVELLKTFLNKLGFVEEKEVYDGGNLQNLSMYLGAFL